MLAVLRGQDIFPASYQSLALWSISNANWQTSPRGCWFCEDRYDNIQPPTMTRTHVLLRCPTFEAVRCEVWKDPTTGAFTRHRSIATLLGNPRWEKRLLKFLEKTTIGKVGPDKIDDEIRRITRYEEWCNLVEDSESDDDEAVSHGRNNGARGTIIVRPPLRAA
jgi:hypothetical protein